MKLPLLASVPHAGLEVPPGLVPKCRLAPEEIVADGDEGAAEVYDVADHVRHLVTTRVARAVLDMNRARDDFRKDGVVKTHTCWDVPIWSEPLAADEVEALLREHWAPYHERLRTLAGEGAVLGVDLHTMAAVGPPVGPDTGSPRPQVCLSHADGTCPDAWMEDLRACFAAEFDEVRVNDPFRGGYITRTHAAELPWVQVELSRAPFAANAEKRRRVLAALAAFCARRAPA